MASENLSNATARRNRLIAIAAGVITVTAIVLAFASGYLGQQWQWLRPAGELLLLAELVGLIVLERHQLFEPVHEKVSGMEARMAEMHAMITENARASGQVNACASTPEVFRTITRVAREALARDQPAPHVLRLARLAGNLARLSGVEEDPDLAAEWLEWVDALSAFYVTPGSPPGGRARRWSVRLIFATATRQNFDANLEQFLRPAYAAKPSNAELKFLVRPKVEAMLSPSLITDREVMIIFDDAGAAFRWAVCFQGPQYLALFERWFDDLWASIPDSHLIYSRSGFNQSAIDRIRKELEGQE